MHASYFKYDPHIYLSFDKQKNRINSKVHNPQGEKSQAQDSRGDLRVISLTKMVQGRI
jgi:hypothetical protein